MEAYEKDVRKYEWVVIVGIVCLTTYLFVLSKCFKKKNINHATDLEDYQFNLNFL